MVHSGHNWGRKHPGATPERLAKKQCGGGVEAARSQPTSGAPSVGLLKGLRSGLVALMTTPGRTVE
ncbi:hypothetical protein Tdes44962_MAKER10470 [Teratosphaeria destructans]|uniref:Uncharacterized protein n=1 Tax=Teratosphaeria destructans TaxID=418781 RepID=A0A9W7T2F3_9PEZI|nr:hypothetical protein Tdes44962_MAKER10470 [Teratosphaeria destructans]